MSFTDTFNIAEDLGIDPRMEDLLLDVHNALKDSTRRIAIIRTSDRIQFRNCRRRWGWQSHLRGNLGPKETASPLWFGSGIHYALEDFHSTNIYGHPARAFEAYVEATRANQKVSELPADWDDLRILGHGMMFYYGTYWLKNREPLKTFIYEGQPQVEVNAHVVIPRDEQPQIVKDNWDQVIYSVTLDRVVEDDDGLLWIVEYKTAKRIVTAHFATDPQVSAYCWIGQLLYGRPIAGVIYVQFRKQLPDLPRILANGEISTNKQMATTHGLYRAQVVRLCGPDYKKWPGKYVDHVNWLAQQESPVHDNFIRRDRIERNEHFTQAEGTKVLLELEEMLNPNIALYPNPTRFQCSFCSFQNACINLDDGSDWQFELQHFFKRRAGKDESWRAKLPPPQALPDLEPPPQLRLL